jgi:hypothetical protein
VSCCSPRVCTFLCVPHLQGFPTKKYVTCLTYVLSTCHIMFVFYVAHEGDRFRIFSSFKCVVMKEMLWLDPVYKLKGSAACC